MRWEEVAAEAVALGFVACGVAPVADLRKEGERLDAWLESGKEAGMAYMTRNREKRRNPEPCTDEKVKGKRIVFFLKKSCCVH